MRNGGASAAQPALPIVARSEFQEPLDEDASHPGRPGVNGPPVLPDEDQEGLGARKKHQHVGCPLFIEVLTEPTITREELNGVPVGFASAALALAVDVLSIRVVDLFVASTPTR